MCQAGTTGITRPPNSPIAARRFPPYITAMSMNHPPPEHPRSEPEIIPAGCDERPPRGPVGVWMRVDERDGVRRVVITHPGPAAIILGLLFLAVIAGIAALALAGFLLVWIPIVIAGILLAFASASIRRRWRLVRAWWASPR
jgi:hypothetical protein